MSQKHIIEEYGYDEFAKTLKTLRKDILRALKKSPKAHLNVFHQVRFVRNGGPQWTRTTDLTLIRGAL